MPKKRLVTKSDSLQYDLKPSPIMFKKQQPGVQSWPQKSPVSSRSSTASSYTTTTTTTNNNDDDDGDKGFNDSGDNTFPPSSPESITHSRVTPPTTAATATTAYTSSTTTIDNNSTINSNSTNSNSYNSDAHNSDVTVLSVFLPTPQPLRKDYQDRPRLESWCPSCWEKTGLQSNNTIQCEGLCRMWYHISCARLTYEAFVMVTSDRRAVWVCDDCYTCVIANTASSPDTASTTQECLDFLELVAQDERNTYEM